MRFFCVSPVLNGAGKIGRTINSIINQSSLVSGRDELHYLIVDGGSTDSTLAEAQSLAGEGIEIRSQQDDGLYDALARTLPESDGDVTFYLNAGDTLEPTAFETVGAIMAEHPEVEWLTGRATVRNQRTEIVNSVLPHPFYRNLMECGAYGTRLPVLQQEGTFWRTELHRGVDFSRLSTACIAGDFLLWKSFAALTDLYVVNSILASFTQEPGQLSVAYGKGAYRREIRELRRSPTIRERLTMLALRLGSRHIIPGRSARRLFSYDFRTERWQLRRHALGQSGAKQG